MAVQPRLASPGSSGSPASSGSRDGEKLIPVILFVDILLHAKTCLLGWLLSTGDSQMSTKGNRKGSSWRKQAFAKVAERDGLTCSQCGVAHRVIWRKQAPCFSWLSDWLHTLVYPTSNLELDHRDPLHRGGTNDLENLWLLCRPCHQAKTSAEQSARLKGLFAEARA